MKKIIKSKRFVIIIFSLVTVLGLLARFINYSELVNFHLDPPLYLHDVKDMVDSGKIRLVGPPVVSKEVMGREFFAGPFHYYVLALLGLVSNWNIIFMSSFYTLLWMAAFAVTFFWFRKRFGDTIALLTYSLLVFFPPLIVMSRGIWNPHFVPLLGILFLLSLVERKKGLHYFLSGLFFGLGLNVHYATLLWGIVAGFFVFRDISLKRFRLINWGVFIAGIVLAEFPLILFELRHNFYNVSTIIFQLKYGSLSRGYTFALWYYYVYPLLPILSFLFAWGLKKTIKTDFFRIAVVCLAALTIFFLAKSFGPAGQEPLYPKGWTIARQKEVARIIKEDYEGEFEVAETINSDTRALDLRWWLRISEVAVMDVTRYDVAPVLYLVTTGKRPPANESVWEVSAMQPFDIEFNKNVGGGILLYKLVRQ